MHRNEATTVPVHFVEHWFFKRFAIEAWINVFTTRLIVCQQVVKNTFRLKDIDLSKSVLFVLVEVGHNWFLEVC